MTTAVERPPVAVEVLRVGTGDVQERVAVSGTLSPKFQGDVKSEYPGTISNIYVTEWIHVTRGTLLARLDARDAESALEAATAARVQTDVAAARAKRELERTENLKAAGLATQQQVDEARTAVEGAVAQLAVVKAAEERARTRRTKIDIRAGMDGVIASRYVNQGDYVTDKPLFRIVDNRVLELTVSIPSSEIGKVALGQPLSFSTDALPGRRFEGAVSFINPSADEASRTVRVIAVIDNRDMALKSGLFVKGTIITRERKGVLRVPQGAMLNWDPAAHSGVLYVVNADRARRRTVATGDVFGDEIEIASGLEPGEAVVTRGAFNLRDGDRVKTVSPTGA